MNEAQKNILVVEDDHNILELITYHLKKEGYGVLQIFTGEEALERARLVRPDLILLDLMLPNMSGLEVCAKLKGDVATHKIPVIIVSARGADFDVVTGLEAGADDYIVKPFRPPLLVERVQEMLRRVGTCQAGAGQDRIYGGLRIIPEKQEALLNGASMPLTDLEFRVLHFLTRHAGCICTRGQIRTALGNEDEDASNAWVDEPVMALIKKLGDMADCIETVRRIGFRFKGPDS